MKIALLGHGTVGSGVYELIMKNRQSFKKKYDKEPLIERILVNHTENYKHLPYNNLFSNRFDDFKEMNFDVAIETIGGIEPAYDYVSYFLSKGIPVITSNKDLIAEKGNILTALARDNNTSIRFEASVAGGIPILKTLEENLAGDQIFEISGILNGTTNFILTKMNNESLSYESALLMAQNLGFAEADPTSDVAGLDSVRKIAILTKLGMNIDIDWKSIPVEGITDITSEDIAYFNKEQLCIKLIGIAKVTKEGIYCSVRPALFNRSSTFSSIDNEFNIVRVHGYAVGELYFIGKGAGQLATATSVLGDLVDLMINSKAKTDPALMKKDSIQFYPNNTDWIVKLTGIMTTDIDEEHISITADTHFLKLSNISEELLIDKFNQLSAQKGCEYKHYLIYE